MASPLAQRNAALGVQHSPLTLARARAAQAEAARLRAASMPAPAKGPYAGITQGPFAGGARPARSQTGASGEGPYATIGEGPYAKALVDGGGKDQPLLKQILGIAVNNPVTRAAVKPMEVLDQPRRSIISGVKEISDVFEGEGASWNDYVDQANDPSFGFGDVAGSTGNKWVDRGIGFAGDVLLDPLTYVTLGAGKFAGASGRAAAAAQLAEKGFAEEVVQRVGRLGVNAADDVAREALGVGEKGLRFGTRNHNVTLGGTQSLADVLGTTLSHGRATVGDTVLGKGARKLTTRPSHLLPSIEKLSTGDGPMSAVEAASRVGQHNVERLKGGTFRSTFLHPGRDVIRGMGERERIALTHAIESGQIDEAALNGRQWLQDVVGGARSAGVDAGDLGPNYVPHSWTDKGRAWLRSNDPLAEQLRRTFKIDLSDGSSAVRSRVILPGTYVINGQTVKLVNGSIDEINTVLGQMVPQVGKFLEDDFAKLASRYLDNVSSDVGRVGGFDYLVDSAAGVAGRTAIQGPGVPAGSAPTQMVVDADATKRAAAKKAATTRTEMIKTQREITGLTADAANTVDNANRQVRQAVGWLDDMGTAHPIDAELSNLRRVASQTKAPQTLKEINEQITRLEGALQKSAANQANKDIDFDAAAQLLRVAARQTADVEAKGWSLAAQASLLRAAKSGQVAPVLKRMLADGWEEVGENLLSTADGVAVRTQLARQMEMVAKEVDNGGLWKYLDHVTRFFKTYATATPGFHFRNAMSAAFMNYSDGVGTKSMLDALPLWRAFEKDPEGFMASATPEVRGAFEATFGSGAGGSFSTAELGAGTSRLVNNPFTRASRKAGEWVEGPARLAMALDTMKRGGTVDEALARITRIHFDYSQVSDFDVTMKRFIPFWTFMSRNLPLQLQQMWLKPKSYAHYQSLVRNLDTGEDGDIVPLAWREAGAFKVDGSLGGDDMYLAPDLPFTRLQKEAEKLFTDPQRLAADLNPVFRLPLELFLADRKMYSGQEFFPDENKWMYAAENLAPTLGQAKRLLPQDDYM
jgi:hypothetical protein